MVGVPGSSPGVSTILELSYKTNYRYYSSMNKLLESFLRSDHAGEVGAVYIYKGILSIATVSYTHLTLPTIALV